MRSLPTALGVVALAAAVPLGAVAQEAPAVTPASATQASPPAAPRGEVTAKIAAGDAAMARLDLEGGLAAYREAYREDPDSYEAAWKLARALTDQATLSKRSDEQRTLCIEAEKIAREAVRLRPSDSKGHAYLAIALGKLALFEGGKRKVELSREVKAEAEEALRLNPDEDLALHVLALWNREMVELNWFLKGFAELLYGKFPPASLDTAIADLRRAVAIHPDVIPHRVELGITLADSGRWREAKEELDTALALPTGWVTDDYYRALARRALARVKAHLE